MKKLFSFTLVLFISLSLLCSNVMADGPRILAKNIDIHKGEEITLSFDITSKSGLAAGGFDLTYDSKIFEYIEYGYGKAFEGGLTTANNLGDEDNDGKGLFKYAFIKADGTNIGGEMFNVTFKTSEQAKVGEKYEFKLVCTEAADKNIDPFKIDSVTVIATVLDGVAPSKDKDSSKIVGDTSATIEAESLLNDADNESKNSNDENNGGGKNNKILFIIIVVLAVIIVATIIAIVLILSKRKQSVTDDDVISNILSADAEIDFTEDALSNEFDEINEFDE